MIETALVTAHDERCLGGAPLVILGMVCVAAACYGVCLMPWSQGTSHEMFPGAQSVSYPGLPQVTFQGTVGYMDSGAPEFGEALGGAAVAESGLWGEGYFFDQVRSRRGRLVLYFELTKRLAGGPLTITELGVACKMNFALTKECLDFLVEDGIVRRTAEEKVKNRYSLTERGYDFLFKWGEVLKMLNDKQTSEIEWNAQL